MNINKMTKAQLIQHIGAQEARLTKAEARLTKATEIYKGMVNTINVQGKQMQELQKTVHKQEKELNTLKAAKYTKSKEHTAVDKQILQAQNNVTETYAKRESNYDGELVDMSDDAYYTSTPFAKAVDNLCYTIAKFRPKKSNMFDYPANLTEKVARAAAAHLRNNNNGFIDYSAEIKAHMDSINASLQAEFEESGVKYIKLSYKEAAADINQHHAQDAYNRLCVFYNGELPTEKYAHTVK